MKFSQRVAQVPLRELWNEHGVASESRLRDLSAADITELLRAGEVQFVVADVGRPLKWVAPGECYEFWKAEAKSHLADLSAENYPENFPGEYCYFASEWESGSGGPIILLAKSH